MSANTIKILVTGADGQLGQEFRYHAADHPGVEFIFANRSDLDITNAVDIERSLTTNTPDFVINCAAYTNVDLAETERDAAFAINADAAGLLAKACRNHHCRLIHFSTDYVFDGNSRIPYTEENPTNPLNVYGASKLKGEQQIQSSAGEYWIIRISWLYGTYGKNFLKTMLRLADTGNNIRVVNDQFASPTYARILAADVIRLIRQTHSNNKSVHSGIYHYTNSGEASWFDFASEILRYKNISPEPVGSDVFPSKSKRPAYSKLNTTKWENTTGIKIVNWQDALASCMKDLTQSTAG